MKPFLFIAPRSTKRHAVLFWSLLVPALMGGCTTTGTTSPETTAMSNGATPITVDKLPPGVADSGQDLPDYRIGALDVLEISVFEVPNLSKSVQVNGSGQIAFPLIGSVPAAGKTTAELKAELEKRLGAKYLQSPQVDVAIKHSPSQRVTVEGAVRQPGIFPLVGEMTLSQTIALARGFDETAEEHGVLVFRRVNGKKNVASFDLTAIQKGQATDPVLQGGDIVVVDQSGLKAAWAGLRSALPVATGVATFVPLL
ncbi:polysaccharide export protein (plasmid) [Bradyrhizobium sp. ISRA443]|uniref:polysaccharide biosynthesis/export family protein n=1 Tax=unclassified Bradyrhizobium TaxID=2631580 RepID=UPI0024789246|nr:MULTISPECIES: polysaccharide biosynthesis/export family protein [unclassified Bradyrhizobium]WGS03063.1 polysaccharide export protein [Bradyrhizobium sp. ISRA436]WGS09903.1 polysaccharide export protein [Bradyrhizobium sp. ISRA437]WGS16788.1 polysaccharide export protein [Bradyrhizobium sp. ISRA443]